MTNSKLIIIGGSAGSLQVILKLFTTIKKDFPVPVVLILHRTPVADQLLEELLNGKTDLMVKEVEEKEMPLPGYLYVCPADYHVLFEKDGSFTLDYSEKINFSRPSIDVAFQSAADAFGEKLICILLSGANADGTDGMTYVKKCRGITIVQDPNDAEVSYMPLQAVQRAKPDHVFNHAEIKKFIEALAE
jgi:two-component system chemotaxis response regulator CheB